MQTASLVKVVVLDEHDNVLLMRRAADDTDRPDDWDFPGGSPEPGEGLLESAARELAEEAGLTISPDKLHVVWSLTEVADGVNKVRLLAACRVADATVQLSHEHSEYQWVSIDEALKIFPHHAWGSGLRHARDNNVLPGPDGAASTETRVLAKVIPVDANDKLLLIRRSKTDPRRPLQWDVPGGHMEQGEMIESTAARETAEESGLSVELESQNVVYAKCEYVAKVSLNIIWIFYAAHVKSPEVKLSWEHDKYRWELLEDAIGLFEYPLHIDMLQYLYDHDVLPHA